VGRRKHALDVSESERDRIRELFVRGVRVADIVWRVKRSESVVTKAVRGLKRPKPTHSKNADRDARMVEMHKQGLSFAVIGDAFAISATRACEIVGTLTGRRQRRPRVRNETHDLLAALEDAGVRHWCPHQLRHARRTPSAWWGATGAE
jgi:hypothetical protein